MTNAGATRGFDPHKDYYAILGVLDSAEDIVVKGAYRALAQRYHPDRFEGGREAATLRMGELNEAYRVLSDSALRERYNREREQPANQPVELSEAALVLGSVSSFEVEQYRPFAERLQEWGYGEAAIHEALLARGIRVAVAEYLARTVTIAAVQRSMPDGSVGDAS